MAILLDNDKTEIKLLTWNKNWIISKYESPWGILQKFKYANKATDNDIFTIFGLDKIKLKKSGFWNNKDRNLYTMEGLDDNFIVNFFGYDIKRTNRETINQFIETLKDNFDEHYFLRKDVHYCTECIKIGYHSIFHQISLFNKCVYHKVELKNKCPKCGLTIPYEINSKQSSNYEAFKCLCGYVFYEEKKACNFMSTWYQNEPLIIQAKELTNLFTINSKQKEMLDQFMFSDFFIKGHSSQFTKYINNLIEKEKCSYHYIVYSKISYHKFTLNSFDNEILEFGDFKIEIYQDFKHIYSSIIRHLKKTILSKHLNCILKTKDSVLHYQNISFCQFASAFFKYRQYNDVLDSTDSIESGKTKRWNLKRINRCSDIEDRIIKEIYDKWLEWIKTHPHLFTVAFKYILFKVMAHLLYNHFFAILKNTKNKDTNGSYNSNLFLNDIPFFAIRVPKDFNEDFEFHWWVKNNYNLS